MIINKWPVEIYFDLGFHLEIQLFVQYLGSYPEVEGDMKEMILVLLNKIVSAVSENVKIALKGTFQKQNLE